MRVQDIHVGKYYAATVSGYMVTVKITYAYMADSRCGTRYRRMRRWRAINLRTGREVTIKSAQRLRREIPCP